ncbi:MMPL family RND transporter, partial [Mycobacterium avium subsp. hominissuis]
MSTTFDDTRTDAIPVVKEPVREKIPRFIRTFAVPIIIGWIALIAVLNVVVPQLDEVGKMRSVEMTPDDAQSVVATKRMGAVFNEYKSNSSVMIVLEGQQPLGADAHAYYDEIVRRLNADTKHVEHVQDMWSDPLTGAG